MIPEKIQLQKKKKKFENYSSKYTPIIFKKSRLRLVVVSHVHMMIMEENEMGSQKKKEISGGLPLLVTDRLLPGKGFSVLVAKSVIKNIV